MEKHVWVGTVNREQAEAQSSVQRPREVARQGVRGARAQRWDALPCRAVVLKGHSCPPGHSGNVWRPVWLSQREEGVQLASCGYWSGVLLNTLQCTAQPPPQGAVGPKCQPAARALAARGGFNRRRAGTGADMHVRKAIRSVLGCRHVV